MNPIRQLAAVALVSVLSATSAHAVEAGDTAPPWRAHGFDGSDVEFPRVLDGKPAIVVFWATWCPYCKAFMPYLEKIQAEYGSDRIGVLMIDAMEDGRGDPQAYIDALGFPLIAVRDGDDVAAAYGVEFTPGLLVIDADGTVVYTRRATQLPAGSAVASLWSSQIRAALRAQLEDEAKAD